MTKELWSTALEEERARFASIGQLPKTLASHPALRVMALLPLLDKAGISLRPARNSVKATLGVGRFRKPDDLVEQVLTGIKKHVEEYVLVARFGEFSVEAWLEESGFDDFVAASIRVGIDDGSRAALLREAGQQASKAVSLVGTLSQQYLATLINLDLGELPSAITRHANERLRWLLSVDHDGDAQRGVIVTRRLQAFTAYAALADLLRKRSVTEAIDRAQPLLPVLCGATGYPRQVIRAATGACSAQNLNYGRDWQPVLAELHNHEVPIHEWPGGGAPNAADAWMNSVWVRRSGTFSDLIRPDYHGVPPESVKDAVEGFRTDLLLPAINAWVSEFGPPVPAARGLLGAMEMRRHGEAVLDAPHRAFLRLVRTVLVGPRRPKSFQQAVALWHRRAATIAALRDEREAGKPGWPALCADWHSSCGQYAIIPLTNAAALVEEGNAHDHCVGGYYDQCRRGDTQILSVRDRGNPVGTVEILLGSDWRRPSLTVNQFKAWRDGIPSPQYHDVLRSFLRALRSGAHPISAKALAAYRKEAAERPYFEGSKTLPLDHARTVYPFYRPLLPRPSPESFGAWFTACGLKAGLEDFLREYPSGDATSQLPGDPEIHL